MKKMILLLLLSAMVCYVKAQVEKVASKNKPSDDIENLQLANQLAKYGYKTFSAEALIQAAKIMSSIKTQDLKYESYTKDPSSNEKPDKPQKQEYDLKSILEAAKKYADGNAKLLAEITNLEKSNQATRGRVGGPGERYDYVIGNSTDSYEISFVESRLAEIAVIGDGDTDLDLYVFDSNLNLIEKDDDYTDRCYVSWVPRWTGRYIVKIINRGPILNNYHLVTN